MYLGEKYLIICLLLTSIPIKGLFREIAFLSMFGMWHFCAQAQLVKSPIIDAASNIVKSYCYMIFFLKCLTYYVCYVTLL